MQQQFSVQGRSGACGLAHTLSRYRNDLTASPELQLV
jgi:hypothetical protein